MLDAITAHAKSIARCSKKKLTKFFFGTTADQDTINWSNATIIFVVWNGKTDRIPIVEQNAANGILNLHCSVVF